MSACERLEDRTLLAATLLGSPDWIDQGPGPMINAQLSVPPNDPAAGAVHSIALHPNQPTHLIVGAAAGGVWRTTNANSAAPAAIEWTPIGDTLGTLSIGAITYDTADPTGNTFYVGAGDFSNSFDGAGRQTGLYRTADAGATWTLLGTATPGGNPLGGLQTKSIIGIGDTVLVSGVNPFVGSRDYRVLGGALYRSTDGGDVFTQEVGVGLNDLPNGAVPSLVQDPNAANTVYAAIPGQGVYLSTNAGDDWTQVNTGLGLTGTESVIELAVEDNGATTTVYGGVATGGTLNGVFSTINAGTNWNALPGALPAQFNAGPNFAEKIQLTVDPDAAGVVYIAGQGGSPAGDAYRYNPGGGGSWTTIFGANGTSPHVDSHDMNFFGNDTLLYAGDGGLYFLNNPDNIGANTWQSFNGVDPNGIRAVEFFAVAYDPNGDRIMGGSQDNGSEIQFGLNDQSWDHVQGGDGQNQEYDPVNNIRYGLGNNFGNFDRAAGGGVGTQLGLRNTAAVISGAVASTSVATAANPVRVNAAAHGLTTGDVVRLSGIAGHASVNNRLFRITVIDADNFDLDGTNNPATFPGGPGAGGTWTLSFSGLQPTDQPVAGAFNGFNAHIPFILNAVDPTRILLGRDGLYESDPANILPTGDVIVDITPTGMGRARAVAYGGRRAGTDYVNVAVVGTTTGQVFFRGEAGAAFTSVALGGSGAVEDIVLDPQDWRRVNVLRGDRIFVTNNITNLGANPFTEVTDNLGAVTDDVRSIELYDITPAAAGDSILLAGVLGGVYRRMNGIWTEYGQQLPNVLVQDVRFSTDDVDGNPANGIGRLIAGTMGRGAWTVDNVSQTIGDKAVLQIDGDADFAGQDDVFQLIRRPENTSLLQVIVNGTSEGIFDIETIQQINVNGLGGNDQLIVDSTNGLITIDMGIRFDGGDGFDRLRLEQTEGTTHTSDRLAIGATNGSGVSYIGNGADDDGDGVIDSSMESDAQTITFTGLEPVIDNVAAATFNITSVAGLASLLDADNAINYTGSQIIAGGGRVTVDSFEPIEFINKTTLVIDGRAGSDTIHLNNPNTPTGLTGITVNGGDPTAGSDTVIVNGTTGVDNVTVDLLTEDGARITGAGPVVTTVAAVEHLVLDGQAASDTVTYTTPTGEDHVTYTPGADYTSGSITGLRELAPFNALLPFSFTNVANFGANALTFADAGGTRVDDLIILGSNENDRFIVSSSGDVVVRKLSDNLLLMPQIDTAGVDHLILQGLNGDDVFDVRGDHPFTDANATPNAGLIIEGGNPGSGSDVLDFTGGGANISVSLAAETITEIGSPAVSYVGIETVNISASFAALTVTGTADDDTISYTPTGATAGTFQNDGDNTVFNFTSVGTTATAGAFTVNGSGDDADRVIVVGTNNHDVITIDSPNRTAIVQNAAGTNLKQVTLGNDVEALTAQGRLGNDTFVVIPAPNLAGDTPNLLIDVDGGLPGASDTLVIGSDANGAALPATDFAVVAPGLTPGEGRVRIFRNQVAMPDVVYSGVEIVFANVATDATGDPQRLIFGPDPNEPNDSRSNATHIGAGEALNSDNLSIFSPLTENFPPFAQIQDQDWFQFVAKETGVLDVQLFFETYPAGLLPGNGVLAMTIRDAAGNFIASSVTGNDNNRITVPVVRNQVYYLQVTGNQGTVNAYEMSVINVPAPVPQTIDLQAASDSGRHDSDDVTNVALSTFDIIVDDDRFDEFTFINVAPDTTDNNIQDSDYGVEVFNNGASIGYAFYTGTGNTWRFTATAGDLNEGHNNFLTAAVWVRDRSTPNIVGTSDQQGPVNALQVTLDTVAPAPPTITIDPATSDTGVDGYPATLVDRITSDTATGFFGIAEADSIVRVAANANSLGLTVTQPFDGDEAFPNGEWDILPNLDLNDPVFAVRDGLRTITATAEDLAGNVGEPGQLDIFIDTQGPQVYDPAGAPRAIQVVTNGVVNPTFDLFDIKPTTGPTPRVDGLLINVQDNPNRIAAFLYEALQTGVPNYAQNPGHYQVVGDRVGVVAIRSVNVVINAPVAGQPATATIQLNFFEPLEDDRFTLTIFDSLQDPAGNGFDGESNAIQPSGSPTFPSGDAIAGGSFAARFTVDSRPEIGVHGQVGVTIDANGNFQLDPTVAGGVNIDITRDLVFQFGLQTDAVFAGQFNPGGVASNGYDRLGAYGLSGGVFRFLLDFNDNGAVDAAGETIVSNVQVNALPLAGDFDNDNAGDEVGLFDGVTWWLDTNGDNLLDTSFSGNMRGLPIAGDFDRDGLTDLAAHVASTNTFNFDLALDGLDGNIDATIAFGFPGVLERPFAADFNLDGVDDIGLTTPSQTGTTGPLEWSILISQGVPVAGTVNTLNHPFSPTPVGGDFAALFGAGQQVPVVGNFDPPLNLPPVDRIFEAETDLFHLIGRADGDGWSANVTDDHPSYLSFGPYVTDISTGSYSAGFKLLVDNNSADNHGVVTVDVFDATAGIALASRTIHRQEFSQANVYQEFDLAFMNTASHAMEFRVFWHGTSFVRQDFVAVTAVSDELTLVAEQNFYHQIGRPDADGWSANVTDDRPGYLSYGPYLTNIPAGEHAAGFKLLVDNNSADNHPVVTIDVFDATAGTVLAGRTIHRREFSQANVYQDFDLSFANTAGHALEFRVFWHGTSYVRQKSTTLSNVPGNLSVPVVTGTALRLAASGQPSNGSAVQSLTPAELTQTAEAAVARLETAGLDDATADRLRTVPIVVTSLPGSLLGWFDRGTGRILIDDNAAGAGWFRDSTPLTDDEFASLSGTGNLLAVTEEARRVDLLSVVLHEFGHALGHSHLDSDYLLPGVRRGAAADQLDEVFTNADDLLHALA